MSFTDNHLRRLLTPQEAVAEASRCLSCDDAPCRKGCPASNDVVKFIRQIAQRNFRGAIKTVRESNVLAGTCAMICPVGELCEFKCTTKLQKPIAIGALQRFVAEYDRQRGMTLLPAKDQNGFSIGIIGSGPAGLSAAFELCRLGYMVEIHEKENLPGGILTYGIPTYRLNPEIVSDEIEYVKAMGAKIITESNIDNLNGFLLIYDAIFIGVGANQPVVPKIEGVDLEKVYQAADFLKDKKIAELRNRPPVINLGKNIMVIGGGNTAIDAAQSATYSGCEVTIFYRRGENEMPAFKSEIELSKKIGVKFKFNYAPVRFQMRNDKIIATFKRTQTDAIDETNRPSLVFVDGSNEEFQTDNILIAVGQKPTFRESHKIEVDSRGLIKVDKESGATSLSGVFAGGDAISGGATAVQAVADGKRAAHGIDLYISSRKNSDLTEGESA